MKLETVVVTVLSENTYIYYDEKTKEAIVIDPGGNSEKIIGAINALGVKVKGILLTHGHGDHIGAVEKVQAHTGASVFAHKDEEELLKSSKLNMSYYMDDNPISVTDSKWFEGDEDEYTFGGCTIKVLHTPGHTRGGVSYYDEYEKIVFTGDTLFLRDVGRTDFPGGNYETLEKSIREKLYTLPDDVIVYPGHGPKTKISKEKVYNNFVKAL
ncbi:MAG: MBL fold metallo-hydrolase [Defluviitaleaceae bacterium]|nr:MBL fold metallo-hydrolase [Defluviitaleaceae bacterium]